MSKLNEVAKYERLLAGEVRSDIENSTLKLMLRGFSRIEIDEKVFDLCSVIGHAVDYVPYLSKTEVELDDRYNSLSDRCKEIVNILFVLKALIDRGLVDRKIEILDDFSPEEGISHLLEKDAPSLGVNNELDIFQILYSIYFKKNPVETSIGRGGEEVPIKVARFRLIYTLTEKGYDVGLVLQRHDDEKKRFQQQNDVMAASSNAAKSSARTARLALIVGGVLAFSSIGNLFLEVFY